MSHPAFAPLPQDTVPARRLRFALDRIAEILAAAACVRERRKDAACLDRVRAETAQAPGFGTALMLVSRSTREVPAVRRAHVGVVSAVPAPGYGVEAKARNASSSADSVNTEKAQRKAGESAGGSWCRREQTGQEDCPTGCSLSFPWGLCRRNRQ
jgi:hypothetical protein